MWVSLLQDVPHTDKPINREQRVVFREREASLNSWKWLSHPDSHSVIGYVEPSQFLEWGKVGLPRVRCVRR